MSVWASSWLGSAVWCDLCGEFSPFCFQNICSLCSPLRFWSPPLASPVRGFSSVQKVFLLHDFLPPDEGPVLSSLVFHFVFIFCTVSLQGDWFAFLEIWDPLPTFGRCSVGIVPHADDFYDIFVGEKAVSPFCSSTSWRSPLKINFNCILTEGFYYYYYFYLETVNS